MKIPRVPIRALHPNSVVAGTTMITPEARFVVHLNDRPVGRIICRPNNPEEPALGWLVNHRVIPSPDAIKTVRVFPDRRLVAIQVRLKGDDTIRLPPPENFDPSEDGFDPSERDNPTEEALKHDGVEIAPHPMAPGRSACESSDLRNRLIRMALRFQELLEVKSILGAFCVAGLADARGALLNHAGDVTVSVAVDRVLGRAFLAEQTLEGGILLISHRIRRDTVGKAYRHGLSSVITFGAVTSLAYENARRLGIELIAARRRGLLHLLTGTICAGDSPQKERLPDDLAGKNTSENREAGGEECV